MVFEWNVIMFIRSLKRFRGKKCVLAKERRHILRPSESIWRLSIECTTFEMFKNEYLIIDERLKEKYEGKKETSMDFSIKEECVRGMVVGSFVVYKTT